MSLKPLFENPIIRTRRPSPLILALLISSVSGHVLAADKSIPDAGQITQEIKNPQTFLEKQVPLMIESPLLKKTPPGGQKVTIHTVGTTGNSMISDDKLREVLGDFKGKEYDLAEIKDLADRITEYYKQQLDCPFAKALIPVQKIDQNHLEIEVVEGRYGQVTVSSKSGIKERYMKSARHFLDTLKEGEVIKGKILERATLILENQPGYKTLPIIRPGQTAGTGDLNVEVMLTKKYGGSISFDSNGDRHTGRQRGTLEAFVNSPFMFGDQINFSTLYSEENLWLGSASYNLPIGSNGLRGQVSYSHTSYKIGKEFSPVEASGIAKIASGSLSYPLIRLQKGNLLASVGYQRKWLNDKQVTFDRNKKSHVLPFSLNFDIRDPLLGGAVTYGVVSWSYGFLNLDDELKRNDDLTARTSGRFNKLNLDISRLQNLPGNLMFFGRFVGQVTKNNLDSSERFGLGGINGVRAYPVGEAFGDSGWATQTELRLNRVKNLTPYIFYDYGSVRLIQDPWEVGVHKNRRTISGTGVGIRGEYKDVKADLSLSWSGVGGKPLSDSHIKNNPLVWLKVSYTF